MWLDFSKLYLALFAIIKALITRTTAITKAKKEAIAPKGNFLKSFLFIIYIITYFTIKKVQIKGFQK